MDGRSTLIKVTEFRQITDTLGRFATTREKAVGPESKIGVQCSNGRLKLIAGSEHAGVVVDVSECAGKFSYIVEARPLLQAAKVLPTKDTVTIEADEQSVRVVASGGGKVAFKAAGPLGSAGFPKKPKALVSAAPVSSEQWSQMAKLFKEVADKQEVPTIRSLDGEVEVTCPAPGSRARLVTLNLGPYVGEEYTSNARLPFWDALRALEGDGTLNWGQDGIVAKAGRSECFSAPYHPDMLAWPTVEIKGTGFIGFALEKKALVGVVKGQAPHDEHNRVTFEVDTGSVHVRAYGAEDGQSVPCRTEGSGVRSVNAEYLLGLLQAMDAKEVTVRWSPEQPAISIAAKEYARWTILLAPVILR